MFRFIVIIFKMEWKSVTENVFQLRYPKFHE